MIRVAILDDYQNIALELADWASLGDRVEVTVFNDHVSDRDEIVNRLLPFDVVCVMRERTPLPRDILSRLPDLKLIASTGSGNPSIDKVAAAECNIEIVNTRYAPTSTIELSWALILASVRNIVAEVVSIRSGGWQ